ncbi:MAG: hypothetical protein EXR77_18480 [Myxococcales bacterium]|nr:hypothetical protein [Myxococcales bacterium]
MRIAGFVPLLLTLTLVATEGPTAWANDAPAMRVAVLEFGNASSEAGLEALGKGLQSMVTTDLSRVASLTLVERSRLQEIVAEQKLATTGLIDKTTAAKIGKLVGASHLLGGTFTVVAKSMRLDARLFSVKSGEVMLAEDMAGDRDAFFELEKALVNKLIVTLGVKLDPKERAGIAKIHTADFGAFKVFSQAVAQFDQQRYDEALDSLRSAMKMDADFGLARVTLGEYEALVGKIRAKAQSIEISSRKLDEAKRDQIYDNDSRVAQRLVEIAGETGAGAQHRRLAALAYLIGFYNPNGRNHGRISRFQDHTDTMLIRRRVNVLARRYFQEAQPVFPDAPLFNTGHHPPDKPEDVEKRVDGLAQSLKQGLEHQAKNRDSGLVNSLRWGPEFGALMAADRRELISLLELAAGKLSTLRADTYERTRVFDQLAEAYLDIGDVDAASGALARASAVETDASNLQRLATRIEELGRLATLFGQTDKKTELRELIAAGERNAASLTKLLGERGVATPKLLRELAEQRELKRWWSHGDPFWMWSGEPAYLIQGEYVATTGPRIDGLSSRNLRYYRSQRTSSKDILIAVGRGPRAEVQANFDLSYSRAADFFPRHTPRDVLTVADLRLDPGRPELTFLFGLRDIDTERTQDPDTRKSFYSEPTFAFGVRFNVTGVALVRVGEQPPSAEQRKPEMTVQVLTEVTKGVTDDKVKVQIVVKGKQVTVTVGSATHKFGLPQDANGMIGVHLRGEGYVEIGDLRLK